MKTLLALLTTIFGFASAAPAERIGGTVSALKNPSVALSSPRGSKLATLFAQLQASPQGSGARQTALDSIFESLKGPVFRADMREVGGVALRYRDVITKMNQENGTDVIRALYDSQPILREYVEEAQGVAVIDEANPPLYMRINRMLKKYKDEVDPLPAIRRDDPVAAEKITALDRALVALPRITGIVFRGGNVSKEEADRMQSGEMSRYNVAPFWSTSSNFKDATGFALRSGSADRVKTVFVIQTKNGKLPTPTLDPNDPNYSPFVLEEEVLLPRGMQFDIVAAKSLALFDPDAEAPLLYVFLNERSTAGSSH
jgi:hypothetical protein